MTASRRVRVHTHGTVVLVLRQLDQEAGQEEVDRRFGVEPVEVEARREHAGLQEQRLRHCGLAQADESAVSELWERPTCMGTACLARTQRTWERAHTHRQHAEGHPEPTTDDSLGQPTGDDLAGSGDGVQLWQVGRLPLDPAAPARLGGTAVD